MVPSVLVESHGSKYSIHSEATNMYRDLWFYNETLSRSPIGLFDMGNMKSLGNDLFKKTQKKVRFIKYKLVTT